MINTAYPLQVGFIAWSPDFKLTGAAQPAVPASFTIETIGGPRTVERIQQEIDAAESCLVRLKAELAVAKPGAERE